MACSGHGSCTGAPTWKCQCHTGFQGGDCSERSCPLGIAWFDFPVSATNAAHVPAECSNAGHCDHRTGECHCLPGFEGAACSRTLCPGALPLDGWITEEQDGRLLDAPFASGPPESPWGNQYVSTAAAPGTRTGSMRGSSFRGGTGS